MVWPGVVVVVNSSGPASFVEPGVSLRSMLPSRASTRTWLRVLVERMLPAARCPMMRMQRQLTRVHVRVAVVRLRADTGRA